jgi:hypothetical protein
VDQRVATPLLADTMHQQDAERDGSVRGWRHDAAPFYATGRE